MKNKNWFPDDPVKNEMMEALKECANNMFNNDTIRKSCAQNYAYKILEKATGLKIEEVLKNE